MFKNEDLKELEKHKNDKTHLGVLSKLVLELIYNLEQKIEKENDPLEILLRHCTCDRSNGSYIAYTCGWCHVQGNYGHAEINYETGGLKR